MYDKSLHVIFFPLKIIYEFVVEKQGLLQIDYLHALNQVVG
jgi:hypothetical protein